MDCVTEGCVGAASFGLCDEATDVDPVSLLDGLAFLPIKFLKRPRSDLFVNDSLRESADPPE